ncbi:MAG: LuxR C-terminal-related transcriptional regulator [Candidatus Promineifilaceae bacterium]
MYNHNLPMQLTPLLGREQEMATLHQLLHRQGLRLITITGPVGVGKTSLALHVAHSAQDSFADGVFYVSLAPISDPTLIILTIAQTLSLPESPRRLWLDSLKEYLQNRQVLLLLDNFEQIITAAPLLTELLSACARLQLLVTSREALRVRGEQEFLLSPLALPDQPAIETLHQYPSIALFVQRAQAVQLEFRLTQQNAAAVAEVCAHLDGLPLAIELAAARIKLFPPQAMLERLQESPLQLLRGGARDLPARQQTLRRAVQWSYDLLEDEEQRAFRWFSVFVGGSTLEAVQAVLGPLTSVDVLGSLVSKSLLRQIETNDAPRFEMLETLREFGWEQLTQTAELEAARRAHAACYASRAEEAEPHLVGVDQKAWLRRLEVEQDNLRAALHWAIENHEGELAKRMAGALQPFWFARGRWSEGRRWLEESLAMDSGATPDRAVRAKVLYRAGVLARFQGDFARARMFCEQSLALYRALADKAGVLMALVQLGRIGRFQDDQKATKAFLSEAASLIEALPDSVVKAGAYSDMAIAKDLGASPYSPETARYLAESERIHRAFNNQAGLALAATLQASRALLEGDYALAASRFDEAERLAMELGDDRLHSRVAVSRVMLDVHEGDFATARRRLEDVLQQAGNRGDHHLSSELKILAGILHRQGLAVWSVRVFGLADAWASTGQASAEEAVLEQYFLTGGIRAEVRAQLGDEAFAREIAAGRRLTLDDLLAIPHPLAHALASGVSLTARENEVLRLLDQDLSNLQIAERLVISRRTVDAHLRSIYHKLGVKSRDAATRVAREQGLLGK